MPPATTLPSVDAATGRRRAAVLALLLLGYGALAFWNAPRRDFWGTEALHAAVAREMEGAFRSPTDWLIPSLGGEPYLVKPPLGYWLSALAGLIPGLDPRAAYRLPPLLFALLSLWLTYSAARRLSSDDVAFLAAAVQASTLLFFQHATSLGTGTAFAFFVSLSVFSSVAGTREGVTRKWRYLAWTGLAGAGLTESLILALILILAALVPHFLLGGGIRRVRRGFAELCDRRGIVLFLALAAPWYVYAAIAHGPELLEQHLGEYHLGRWSGTSGEARPPYFYFLAVFPALLPWSLFLPLGLLHSKDRLRRPGERAGLSWSLTALIVMSLLASKHVPALLVVVPPVSFMVAAAFLETREQFSLWEDYLRGYLFRIVPVLLKAPALLVAAGAVAWLLELHEKLPPGPLQDVLRDKSAATALLVLGGLGAALALVASARIGKMLARGDLWTAVHEFARATLFLLFIGSFVLPVLDPLQSSRSFLERVEAAVGTAPLATYGDERPVTVHYYLPDRPVPHFEEPDPGAEEGGEPDQPRAALEAYLDARGRRYLLASARDLAGLDAQFPGIYARLTEAFRGRMGQQGEFVLMVTREE